MITARLNNADMALWQQVEKSLLLARTGWTVITSQHRPRCASVINRWRMLSVMKLPIFLARLPALINLLFNDRTPFVSEQTKQWLASSGSVNQTVPVVQTDEELQAAKACFDEYGLEAALRYRKTCPKVIPATSFTASFRRAVTGRGRYGSACNSGTGCSSEQDYT